MSQPGNTPTPHYVVCDCQHCGGHIEFDANEFAEENSIVPCPHCGLETKIFMPILQVEKDSTELPSPVASPKAVKREGFFCGGDEPVPAPVSAEQPATKGRSERQSIGNAPELTANQIKSVGQRQNDGMAAKLFHEGDQDMAMSLDDARRYIADPRFKLINPETGLRFTSATLEAFIKAKRLQNKIETALPEKPRTQNITPETEQNPFPASDEEPSVLHKHKRVRFTKGTRISETRAFTFNWRCRNEQIEAAFRLWLQKNRPSQWANDAKGEKVISLRVDLERLGKMRKIKANPAQTDAENNKEARRAFLCFRELFPKLTEYPLNWPWPVDTANRPQE